VYPPSKANECIRKALSISLVSSILVLLVLPVYGDSTRSLLMGRRYLDDGEDVLPSLGVYYRFDIDNFVIEPEISATLGFDPVFGGSEYDLGIGGVYQIKKKLFTIDLGIGISYFSREFGANETDGSTYYWRAAIIWNNSDTHGVGLDFRRLKVINSSSNALSNTEDVGYFQTSLVWQFNW
jgi:hypothetical protein